MFQPDQTFSMVRKMNRKTASIYYEDGRLFITRIEHGLKTQSSKKQVRQAAKGLQALLFSL
jgi:hypothetical protein